HIPQTITSRRDVVEDTSAVDRIVVDVSYASSAQRECASPVSPQIVIVFGDVVSNRVWSCGVVDQERRPSVIVAVVILDDRVRYAFIEIICRPVTPARKG